MADQKHVVSQLDVEKGDVSPISTEPRSKIPLKPFSIFTKFLLGALGLYMIFPHARSLSPAPFSSSARSALLAEGSINYLQSRLDPDDFSRYQACQSLPSPSLKSYVSRQSTLSSTLQSLRSGSDIYITEPSPSGSYYVNISSSHTWSLSERPFLIVVAPKITEEVIILTPNFEADRARILPIAVAQTQEGDKNVRFVEWKEEESPYAVLLSALGFPSSSSSSSSLNTRPLKIHLDPLTRQFIHSGIQSELLNRGFSIDDGHVEVGLADPEVLSVRERKVGEELELLRCANELTIQAIRLTKQDMYLGIKESETSSILKGHMGRLGIVGGGGLILFGENAALPHGSGTDKVLGKHDLVLIDAGGTFRGYVSDITRTFALPRTKLSKTQLRLWDTVARAQAAALKAGVAGATGRDVDMAARGVVESSGLRAVEREGFTHRLGHGIGLEGHEAPYLVGSNNVPIQTGNAFSDEPGIYILGEVGVRLEDCWFVDENGVGKLFTGPAKSVYEP